MKKNISIALAITFAFGGFNWVSAQTTATGATGTAPTGIRQPLRDARAEMEARTKALRASSTMIQKNLRGEIRDERGNLRASTTEMRSNYRASTTEMVARGKAMAETKQREAAKKQAAMIMNRIDAAIDRVQKLSDRTSARLDKFASTGVNVSSSRGHLAEAKMKLDEARAKSAVIKTAIDAALASQTPKDSMKSVETLVKNETKVLQDAQRHVSQAISSIKSGRDNERHATTTSVKPQ